LVTNIKYRSDFHHDAYVVNVALIAMSLPLSKFTMSLFEISLALLWILSGFSFRIVFRFFKLGNPAEGVWHTLVYIAKTIRLNFFEKFRRFFRNKPALILTSIYLLHLLGLFYTTNFDYASKDLRIKLPLLLFPVIFSTMPKLSAVEIKKIFLGYIAAITAGIIISFYLLYTSNFTDVREISPFISPIRFSLNIAFGFFVLISFVFFDKSFTTKQKSGFVFLMLFFIVFLFHLESITGLSAILIAGGVLLVILLFKTKFTVLKVAFVLLIIAIPVSTLIYIKRIITEATTPPAINVKVLDKKTSRGNKYTHDLTREIDNGKYVGIYLCEKELRSEWNKKSRISYDSLTLSGEPLSATLIRYLTSKDLRKDADGVDALSTWDIQMVEKGVANICYVKNPGMRTRILKIIYGYQVYKKLGDPSGNSIMQRYEYMRASIRLIKKYFFTGVGTGDLEDALYGQYKVMKSKLHMEFRFHAHNQFLAIAIAFGVFGLLWFIFALIYPPVKLHYFKDYYFLVFFIIIIWSMFTDDTLETQAGSTLFGFYYSLLLFGRKGIKNIVS